MLVGIFREGNKAVVAGRNPMDLKRGMDKAKQPQLLPSNPFNSM